MKQVTTELTNLVEAWLTPQGEYVVDYTGRDRDHNFHDGVAQAFLKDHFKLDKEWEVYDHLGKHDYPYEYLEEEMGWIRLFSFAGNLRARFLVVLGYSPTNAQAQAMMDWADANGVDLKNHVDDENGEMKRR